LLDAYIDNRKIVKSHIPTVNTPAKIEVPVGQSINIIANESKAHLKCVRPIDANDKILRKRKAQGNEISTLEEALPTKQTTKIDQSKLYVQNSPRKESLEKEFPEKEQVPENNEISINYVSI
jgi:hypothetical protein